MKIKYDSSLKGYIKFAFILILGVISILLLLLIILGILFLTLRTEGLLIALSILVPFFILLAAAAIVFSFINISHFSDSFFSITKKNYAAIYNEEKQLTKYEQTNIEELKNLNDEIKKINVFYSNVNILNNYNNYNHIPLEFYSKNKGLLNEKTFKMYIKEIISTSQIFRNAIIQVSFDEKHKLDEKNVNLVVDAAREIFENSGLLISINEDRNNFYVYVPKIDSLSLLKEDLNTLLQKVSFVDKSIKGVSLMVPRIHAVVYPYTSLEDIFSDLEYSLRQENSVNLYLPDKLVNQKSSRLLHSTMNINTINKIICELSEQSKSNPNLADFIKGVSLSLRKVIDYLQVDEAGIILYDAVNKQYINRLVVDGIDIINQIIPLDSVIDDDFVDLINKCSDVDGSYYFSSRSRVNTKLGRYLDKKNISSGFFYNVSDKENHILSIVYFANTNNKNILFDSYIRESLLTISALTTFTILNCYSKNLVEEMKLREENLLKVSNISGYTINKKTYEIVDFSDSVKILAPNIKKGDICHKAFFGLEHPCKNCPLLTRNKVIKKFGDGEYQVSFSINNKINNHAEFLIKRIDKNEEINNRFDPETGINSIYSFHERVKSIYLCKSKGYIISIVINNSKELLEKVGNEGYSMLLRLFANDISQKVLNDEEVYLYKDNTLLVLIPEVGKIDVLDTVEAIYPLSKKDYLGDDTKIKMNLGYTAIKFPQEFASSEDLFRHIERVLNGRDVEKMVNDNVLLEENGFIRPANRVDYLLKIADEAVKEDKFIIKVQPVVDGVDKRVFGSEILIRLTDVERDTMLNTKELIDVLANNNKLNLISDKLIDFVFETYSTYGASLFKANKITRISINADYNFFAQKEFLKTLNEKIIEKKMPKNFLVFEIPEAEIGANFDGFKALMPEIKKSNIEIICDQYNGSILSLKRLASLGIKEIKTDTKVCNDIDISMEKLNALRMIVDRAKENDIKLTILGIENGAQYKIINENFKDIYMQGYYFYHPISLREFVDIIKQTKNF